MKSNFHSLSLNWLTIVVAAASLAGLSAPVFAQDAPTVKVGNARITGLPEDWSTHHVVFADPGTEQDAIQAGRHDQWQKIVNDPRYVIQQLKRNAPVQGPAAVDANYRAEWLSEISGSRNATPAGREGLSPTGGITDHSIRPIRVGGRERKLTSGGIDSDWNQAVGTTNATTAINYPAKWSFSTSAASCTSDFVVYPTGQAGSTTQASIIAYYNLYGQCSGTVPGVDWAYNTGATVSLAPVFSANGNQIALIQTTGSGSVTATTTTNSTSFTVTTGTINSSEIGSLISGTGIPTGDTIATVTSSTTGTLTTAATTGGTGTALTITGVAQLVLITYPLTPPGTGTLSAPIAPTAKTASAYYNSGLGCTAPCSFTATLSGSPVDTWSNPYYDYTDDILYVGDSVGKLHKFSPVFRGAPAESGGAWPVQMVRGSTTDNNQLASPVYDTISRNVFLGSTTSVSATTGGYFYSVNGSTGAINGYSSTQLDGEYGIRDAPLFDPVAEKAYVSVGYNATSGDSGVYQFSATGFSGSTAPAGSVTTGAGATSDDAYLFSGTFDNVYYTSSNGASPSGDLYVCASGLGGTLYKIPITSNVMGTPVAGPTLTDTGHYGRCSAFTEFYNSNGVGTAASGTITIATDPAGWNTPYPTVTVGSTTYTFVTGAPGTNKNEVEMYTASTTASTNEGRTADNLEAVINADSNDCYTADRPACLPTGQTENAAATVTGLTGAVLTVTATNTGTGSDFALSAVVGGTGGNNNGAVTFGGGTGSNGTNGTGADYLIFSNFAGTQGGCTNNTGDGCVMSFNITTPSSFSTSTVPLAALNIASQNLTTASATNPAAVTSGIIVDSNTSGQAEMYFLTQDNSATTACVTGGGDGICAIQAAQSEP